MTKKIDAPLTTAEQVFNTKLQNTWKAAQGLEVGSQVKFTGHCMLEEIDSHPLKGAEGIIVDISYNPQMGYDCIVAVPRGVWEAAMEMTADGGVLFGQFVHQEASILSELASV